MAEVKGTDIIVLRKLAKEKNSDIEKIILEKLSDQGKDAYLNSLSVSWLPLNIHAEIFQTAADTIYPDSPRSVYELAFEVAKRTYTGLYKIFLSIPSLPFIIKRTASIWKTYYNAGQAHVENVTSSSLEFIVTDFPTWPKVLRESTSAHLAYLAEVAGKKKITVKHDDSNRKKWLWHVKWRAD